MNISSRMQRNTKDARDCGKLTAAVTNAQIPVISEKHKCPVSDRVLTSTIRFPNFLGFSQRNKFRPLSRSRKSKLGLKLLARFHQI